MTPTVSPLPIEGSPVPGESLMGFVLRMSLANHFSGIQWLGTILGKDRIFHLSNDQVPTISWIFGAPIESLRDISISFVAGNRNSYWNFYSHPISKSYLIRHRTPQLCTKCIEETGVIKKIWDLRAVTVCPVHRILLSDLCEQCGKQISWNRPSIFSCACTFDFRRSKLTPMSPDECKIAQSLENKLLIDDNLLANLTLTDPIGLLNPLSVDGAARIILATGLLKDSTDLLAAGKSKKRIGTKTMHEVGKRSISRLASLGYGFDDRKICAEFLTTALLNLERDGLNQSDRDLAWQLVHLGRKGLPSRASLLGRNPRSQLELF